MSQNQATPPDDDPVRTATYLRGLRNGYAAAAKSLDVSRADIRLAAGEMTAKEMRSVLAVLAWRRRKLEEMAADVRV